MLKFKDIVWKEETAAQARKGMIDNLVSLMFIIHHGGPDERLLVGREIRAMLPDVRLFLRAGELMNKLETCCIEPECFRKTMDELLQAYPAIVRKYAAHTHPRPWKSAI